VLFLTHQNPDNKGKRQTQRSTMSTNVCTSPLSTEKQGDLTSSKILKAMFLFNKTIKLKYLDTKTTILTKERGRKSQRKTRT
jgi:hypothetical protein